MNIKVIRKEFTENSTIGELYINDKFFCYTLEDKDRKLESAGAKAKVQDKTAIPRGEYQVVMSFSNRFKTYMPELLNVPYFAGIRIHSGNTAAHSEGCILLGATKSKDFVGNSRVTVAKFYSELKKVEKKEKIFITIG